MQQIPAEATLLGCQILVHLLPLLHTAVQWHCTPYALQDTSTLLLSCDQHRLMWAMLQVLKL